MYKSIFEVFLILMMARAVYKYVKFRLIKAKFYRLYNKMSDAPLDGYSNLGEKQITPEFEKYVQELKERGCRFKQVFCFEPEIIFPYRVFFEKEEMLNISSLIHFYASQFFFFLTLLWMCYWNVNGLTVVVLFFCFLFLIASVADD